MSLQSIAESLRTALFQSRQSAAELKAKLAELRAERKRIANAPLCRADLEGLLLASMERQRARAIDDQELLASIQYGHQLAGALANGDDPAHLADMTPLTNRYDNLVSLTEWDKLALLLGTPDTILAALKPVIDKMDFSQAGRPMDKRRAKIVQLDKEIATLELELTGIESAISATQDVAPDVPSNEPAYGERRQIDGSWATWAAVYPGAKPGWVYDQ